MSLLSSAVGQRGEGGRPRRTGRPRDCRSYSTAPVVKVHERVVSRLPARSRIAAGPPVTVTRYWTLAARLAAGLIVATVPPPVVVTVAATVAPFDTRVRVTDWAEIPATTSLKVTVRFRARRTPVAPEA